MTMAAGLAGEYGHLGYQPSLWMTVALDRDRPARGEPAVRYLDRTIPVPDRFHPGSLNPAG